VGLDKFLDDDNIITKDEAENVDFSFEGEVEEEIQEPEPPKPKKRKVPKSTSQKKKEVSKKTEEINEVKSAIKSRKEIIADLINRFQEQKILKEVDLDLHHFLYNNGGSNEERTRCELIIKNLANEIRSIEKKIKFLQEKYKAE
jgi:hypothetical protein